MGWYIALYPLAQFPTKSQIDLDYHFAKKHIAPKLDVTFNCKLCYQEFQEFYALRQHENTQNGVPIRTANVDADDTMNEVDDVNLKQKLRSCQYFVVNTELERAGQKVFNYAIENFKAKIVSKKLDHFLNNLKCAAK